MTEIIELERKELVELFEVSYILDGPGIVSKLKTYCALSHAVLMTEPTENIIYKISWLEKEYNVIIEARGSELLTFPHDDYSLCMSLGDLEDKVLVYASRVEEMDE